MLDDHQLKPDLTFTATHKDDSYGREAIMRYTKSLDMAIAISAITRSDTICEKCRDEIIDILNEYSVYIEQLTS